jgi:hypothetical protein
MASKAVEDAIDAYLAANWSDPPIIDENEQGETPTDGSPFLVIQYPASNVERLSISNRLYRETGGFRIVINVERGSGKERIKEVGEALADLFRDQKIGVVNCLVPTEPFTDNDSDQGNFFTGAMVVPFTYEFTG